MCARVQTEASSVHCTRQSPSAASAFIRTRAIQVGEFHRFNPVVNSLSFLIDLASILELQSFPPGYGRSN